MHDGNNRKDGALVQELVSHDEPYNSNTKLASWLSR